MSKSTTITLINEFGEYSVSAHHSGLNIDQIMQLIRSLLLASGYHESNISQYIESE